MEQITLKNLVYKLNKLEKQEIQIQLKGIIIMNKKIILHNILCTKDYIEIYNTENNENIKFNIHQIKKIEEISTEKFLIKFDGLQTLEINKISKVIKN